MSAQEALVAFAGPAMNLIIAIILTVISFCFSPHSDIPYLENPPPEYPYLENRNVA